MVINTLNKENQYVIVVAIINGISLILLILQIIIKIKKPNLNNKRVNQVSKLKNKSNFINFVLKNESLINDSLIFCDDILMPMLISMIWIESMGKNGFTCAKCFYQKQPCFQNNFYHSYINKLKIIVFSRIILSIILTFHKTVFKFFKWTETGTIFDFIVLRIISTVIYSFIVLLIIFTPTFYVFYNYYFLKYSGNLTVFVFIKSVQPYGILLWIFLISYKIFYVILTYFMF